MPGTRIKRRSIPQDPVGHPVARTVPVTDFGRRVVRVTSARILAGAGQGGRAGCEDGRVDVTRRRVRQGLRHGSRSVSKKR